MTLIAEEPLLIEEPLETIDAELFRTHFNRRPFKIGHHLVEHPLLSLEGLAGLAATLPESSVEYNAGDLPASQDPSTTPRNGLSVTETIERIEHCRSWMVLKNVEQDRRYADLIDRCLDQIQPHSEPLSPGMHRREAFIFVSSPGSVTPFHIDPENNFLLQIRGEKEVQLFDARDRFVLAEDDIERFFCGAHRNLMLRREHSDRGQWYHLTPGEGLHFPVIAPHWVKNGPEVSISLSITFRTQESDDRAALYRVNHWIRRRGLTPSPVGHFPRCDRFKLRLVGLGRAAKRALGRAGGQSDAAARKM